MTYFEDRRRKKIIENEWNKVQSKLIGPALVIGGIILILVAWGIIR